MRKEPTRIEEQVRRAFEGEAWHGPSVLEVLADLSAEAASAHPIPRAHSIWEIVLHLAATYRLVLERIQGRAGSLTVEQDWPAVGAPYPKRWREAVDELRHLNREVRQAVLAFAEERLEEPLASGHSSAYAHFAGLAQHDAYHAGQIAILRRASSVQSV